ncbi:hypothetical protein HNR37_001863 [Desulfurispira natronophila]|uniref:Uncharacterized protein n=1 Tax=Desulfurispira natronophila TaxID=682562 RepID=A0A7W7Y5L3_9BACT|nr:hypothetical protein [Desulfurispira natronophila]
MGLFQQERQCSESEPGWRAAETRAMDESERLWEEHWRECCDKNPHKATSHLSPRRP